MKCNIALQRISVIQKWTSIWRSELNEVWNFKNLCLENSIRYVRVEEDRKIQEISFSKEKRDTIFNNINIYIYIYYI